MDIELIDDIIVKFYMFKLRISIEIYSNCFILLCYKKTSIIHLLIAKDFVNKFASLLHNKCS